MAAKKIVNLLHQVQTTTGTLDGYYPGPSELIDNLMTAQGVLFNWLVGLISGYQNGRPVPAVGSEVTYDTVEMLDPFRVFLTITKDQGTGIFNIVPPAGRRIIKTETFWLGEDSEITIPSSGRLMAFTKNPNRTVPVGKTLGRSAIQVFPASIATIQAQVLLAAKDPVIVFTEGKVDEVLTEETEWTDRAIPFLYYGMCKAFGIEVANPFLYQSSQQSGASST